YLRAVVIRVEKHMANGGDGVSSSGTPIGRDRIHAKKDAPVRLVAPTEPCLEPGICDERAGADALRSCGRLVRLEEHSHPVLGLVGRFEEHEWRALVDRCHGAHVPDLVKTTRPRKVDCARVGQSTPEKSASIRVASAMPTLKRLPVHPRGEG